MNLPTLLLPTSDFIKAADTMPNGQKLFLLLALLLTFLAGYALRQLPAILREVPSTIRALREQPGKAQPENHAEGAKGQVN